MLIDLTADTTILILFTDPETGESESADSLPTFRIFGQNGAVTNGAGTAEVFEDGNISAISTGATTTVTTSGAHGLVTGSVIQIAGAAGTTGVNGVHQITVTSSTQFTFNDVASSGTYTSGASWMTPGLYGCVLDATIRSALEVGRNYTLVCYGVFGSDVRAKEIGFTVVA